MVAGSAAVAAPAASAHAGDSLCTAELAQSGSSYAGACTSPFQGFPIGFAGVYDSDPEGLSEPGTKDAEIHVEVMAKMASGPPQPLGVECIEITKGVARCRGEYNPFDSPLTLPEPAPQQVVAIICNGHSHAKYSRLAPPAGRFACWSTDEAGEHLASDGWFADNGFED